jgi:hypothetical protein
MPTNILHLKNTQKATQYTYLSISCSQPNEHEKKYQDEIIKSILKPILNNGLYEEKIIFFFVSSFRINDKRDNMIRPSD